MLFSLIVPVYNVAAYLPKCMESLRRQDFTDYEVILVDDGSTDGKSGGLCDEYAAGAPNIHVIHQENGGLGAARNTGLEHAAGDYVFFIDSDDYIADGSLSALAEAIARQPADMYVFAFQYVHGETYTPAEPTSVPMHTPLSLSSNPELLLEPPSAWLRVCRRSLFLDHGIRFPGRVWYEDLRTTPKCLYYAKTVVYLPNALYFYVQRDGSIMHSASTRRNLEILDALEELHRFFSDKPVSPGFSDVLCYLDVNNCLMAAQRALMADPTADYLPQFLDYAVRTDPDYRKNPLLPRLGRKKLLVLRLLEHQRFRLLHAMFTLLHRMR